MAVNSIWVLGEASEDKPTPATLELLTKARSLASDVACFFVGSGAEQMAPELGRYGATTVYAVDAGDTLPAGPAAAALADLVAERSPDLILFPTSYTGRDVCGRLSARIDRPVISNGSDIRVEGDDVVVEAAIFGGTTLVDTAFRCDPPRLALFRPKSFAAEPADGGSPEVLALSMPEVGAAGAARVLERHVEKAEGPKLEEADIVVAGGRGLGSAENYKLVDDLAEALRAAKGASRAIVDAGWVPYSYQVGQTGKVVKPRVYIALGISGAMQHMVGMKDAGHIIAVNKDSEAPIFGIASFGVVGDVHKVVPPLIEALKNR